MEPRATKLRRCKELARRENAGIEVSLVWHPDDDSVSMLVADAASNESLTFEVAPERALDAFYHPYIYAFAAATGTTRQTAQERTRA